MERWWPRSPLRGKGLRERRRLLSVARSGERIDDPHDAEIVRSLIEYQDWFAGTWSMKFMLGVGPWVVIPTSLALIVYWALQHQVLHAAFWVVLMAVYALAFRLVPQRLRSHRRTAQANGWESSD